MPLDTRKIVKGKELGKGGFGVVYKCTIDGQECAAKYLLGQYSPEVHEDFRKECAYMEKFSDPNIVFLVGYAANPPELCIVTELCTGSLFDVIQKQGRMLSTPTIIRVANEIAMGLKTLHAAGMIHRDLKSLNVLIDAGMHAKVADLGLSTDKASGTHTQGVIGTPLWSAPEVLRGDKYDNKADVYSYGIMLYEMTHLQLPYYDQPPNMNKIMHEVGFGQLRPRIRQGTHGGLAALMQRCWQQDARARPSMDEIITTLNGMQA
jgi:serine/threonine protein kinase